VLRRHFYTLLPITARRSNMRKIKLLLQHYYYKLSFNLRHTFIRPIRFWVDKKYQVKEVARMYDMEVHRLLREEGIRDNQISSARKKKPL
jgi:hypothetical protein